MGTGLKGQSVSAGAPLDILNDLLGKQNEGGVVKESWRDQMLGVLGNPTPTGVVSG